MGCHLPDKLLHPNWFLKIASAKLDGNEFFNKAAELWKCSSYADLAVLYFWSALSEDML